VKYYSPQGAEVERILDTAFQRTPLAAGNAAEIVVEIMPSCHPESRIDIVAKPGLPGVVRYARAAVSLQDTAMQLRLQGHGTEPEIARAMGVTEATFTRSPEYLKRLVRGFWDSLAGSAPALARRSLDGRVQLDGAEYRLRIHDAHADVTLDLVDHEIDAPAHPGRLPLLAWISGLIREYDAELRHAPGSER
jgi:hypothetical protein